MYSAALEVMFEMARHFKQLDFIDLGSGFKVPYKEGDPETDVYTLGEKLTERYKGI